jgi:L-ascorbate metabolism protein UlaG (beta-lactamase superfamily)
MKLSDRKPEETNLSRRYFMTKLLWISYILLLSAINPISLAEKSKEVIFTHYGHACFMITTPNSTRILTDPPNLEGYDVPDSARPDIITISHRHIDHDNVAAVSGNPTILYGCNGPMDKGLEHKFFPIDTQVNEVQIYNIVSNHFDPKINPFLNSIFIFEFDGIRVAHLGDFGYKLNDEQRAQIGTIDILMIPVGGVYTIAPVEANEVIAQLGPKVIVLPMHYKTKVASFLEFTAEDFLKNKRNVKRISPNSFKLDLDNLPDKMQYIILNASEK